MHFVFDIRKSVAATGYLCKLNKGKIDMLKVIKMLYLADRQALLEWQRPITGDQFWSLEHGPIVSRIYDLIRGKVGGSDRENWFAVFNPRHQDTVSLRAEPNIKPLSRREKSALDEAYHKINPLDIGDVIRLVHKLPEWKDPGKSSIPIDPKDIFYFANIDKEVVAQIETEIEAYQEEKVALQIS